jgi:hypothetical protein
MIDSLPTNLTIEQIWGAAYQALIVNDGAYIKQIYIEDDPEKYEGKRTNQELVRFYASNTDNISEQSIKDGIEIRAYLNRMMFKILADEKIGDYFTKLFKLATDENLQLTNKNIGYICSAPNAVIREQRKDEMNKEIKTASGGYIGSEKDKVQLNIKILRSHYSEQWERHYVTGITTNNQVVSFSTKNKRLISPNTTVSVKAIVVKHYIDEYTKQETTKLTHVKTAIYI